MTPQSIGTRESPTTSPLSTSLEVTFADKFLLSRMETLVSFPVVLASKSLATYSAHKGSLVGVCPQMGAQVVSACETLGAQRALEGCWMFLYSLTRPGVLAALVLRVGQAKCDDIIGDCGRRLSPS